MGRGTGRYIPLLIVSVLVAAGVARGQDDVDPYLWLEKYDSRTYQWILDQDTRSEAILGVTPGFRWLYATLAATYNSAGRIALPSPHGDFFYNFWQDADHVRGIWRRTTLAEYRKSNPTWETVLDLDAVAKAEQREWVWQSSIFLHPGNDRCLIGLSDRGEDSSTIREFDLHAKQFVQGGFEIPRTSAGVSWLDRDTLCVSERINPHPTTTPSVTMPSTPMDWPVFVMEWKRGTALADAKVIYRSENGGFARALVKRDHGQLYEVLEHYVSTFERKYSIRRNDT